MPAPCLGSAQKFICPQLFDTNVFVQDVICLPCRVLQLIADALIVVLCCPCRQAPCAWQSLQSL